MGNCIDVNDCDNDGVLVADDCDDMDPLIIDGTVRRNPNEQCIAGSWVPFTPDHTLICGGGTLSLPLGAASGETIDVPAGCSGTLDITTDGLIFHGQGANGATIPLKWRILADDISMQDLNIQNVPSLDAVAVAGNTAGRLSGFIFKGNRMANNGSPTYVVGGVGGAANIELHSTDGAIVRNNSIEGPIADSGASGIGNLFNVVTFRSNTYNFSYNHFTWPNRPTGALRCVGAKHGNVVGNCVNQFDTTCTEDTGNGLYFKNVFESNCEGTTGQGRDTWDSNLFRNSGGWNHQDRGGPAYIDDTLFTNNTVIGDPVTFSLLSIYHDDSVNPAVKRLGPVTVSKNVIIEDSASGNGGSNIINYARYIKDVAGTPTEPIYSELLNPAYRPTFEDNCYFNTGGTTLWGWAQSSTSGGPSGGSCPFADWQEPYIPADIPNNIPASGNPDCPLALDTSSQFADPQLDACGCTTSTTCGLLDAGWCANSIVAPIEASIAVLDSSAGEPNNDGSFLISLSAVAPAGGTTILISIDTFSSDAATNGVDYTTIPTSYFIPAGISNIAIPIDVLDDLLVEGDEFITLTIVGTSNGVTTGNPTTAILTITDNDPETTTPNTSSGAWWTKKRNNPRRCRFAGWFCR